MTGSPPSLGLSTRNQNGIRRTAEPSVSTTKPVTSASGADGVAATVTSSGPGTVTVGGTVTVTPDGPPCSATAAVQGPAPPPASVSVTGRVACVPVRTSPNERSAGAAKMSGTFAAGTWTRPPPSRVVGSSFAAEGTGLPVRTSADLTCAGVQSGWRWSRRAAAPATCGVAMLVPLNEAHVPSAGGTEEVMSTPGADTSGFIPSEIGVGPLLEKEAIASCFVTAAAVIAFAALPGEETLPRPKSSKSLPAAITGTTPASAAALIAVVTRSRAGSISASPSERLITSMPSLTAASTPAAISGAFPLRPKFSVG